MRRNSDKEIGMEMGLKVLPRQRRRRSCSNGKKERRKEEEETNNEAEMVALFPLLVAAISKQRDGRRASRADQEMPQKTPLLDCFLRRPSIPSYRYLVGDPANPQFQVEPPTSPVVDLISGFCSLFLSRHILVVVYRYQGMAFLEDPDVIQHLFSSIFPHMVSCPPISSDEFDILHFINKEREELGRPLTYEQDIRVLKAERNLNKENNLFQGEKPHSCEDSPHVFSNEDIHKCEETFNSGHAIAICGMEFQLKSITAVVEGLANLFGQPSVGANLYLTPPDSRGLHYYPFPSLHLTFAIEVEAPFEWEGFMHVALHHWFLNASKLFPLDASTRTLDMEAVRLLHIGVMLLGGTSPMFCKACLVNSSSSSLNANNWLFENQRAHFQQLLHEMSMQSMFSEACHRLTRAIHMKEDPVQKISRLQDLDENEEFGNDCQIHSMFGRAVKD
ncbi:hypothetical protein MLD38_005945 [Melastoma candidum]|uniref:Uncharacterized protein n=1 Tax=Melastoma candidum TaxID=119954 RepID=A0ACB9RL15_9MYRT|nr:hypothetical protein MLD38_005945 [Melastoma candidum]